MLPAGLSFDQAPPITVPFRFFLVAPLFLLLAAALLLALGPDALLMRRLPGTLAVVHLVTLGFTSMVMTGALMQMLPVVAGVPVRTPVAVAWLVQVPLLAGALLLPAGLLWSHPLLLTAGAHALGLAFALFLGATLRSLIRAKGDNPAIPAMGLALLALLVAATLGLGLALVRAGKTDLPYGVLATLHPGWALLGWTALLVFGVAYQVVPMFQLTANYPRPFSRLLVPGLFALLALLSGAEALDLPILAGMAEGGLALGCTAFAFITLRLQAKRRRTLTDATLLFWRAGMGFLLLACLLWGALLLVPGPTGSEALWLLLGVAFLPGFVLAVINGMLYKIVPFLAWFHLQSRYVGRVKIPNMKEFQPEAAARGQLRVFLGAEALLLGAVLWPPLVYPAGIAFLVSSGWLGANLWRAWRLYRTTAAKAEAALQAPPVAL